MPHTRYPRLATPIALSLLLAWLSGSVLAAAETPNLSGTWQLDEDLSEDPMEKMREGGGEGMRGGGRGGGMGGGGGGWGGGMGGGRSGGRAGGMGGGSQAPGQSREEMRQRMQELRASIERLNIHQTDSSVRIVFADSREQTFTTDNKKSTIETPFGEGTIKAKWRDDGGLVVKTKTERGKIIETYYVTRDGLLLTVLVEKASEGPMGSVSFKRVYRPVDPEAEMEAEPASS